MAEKKLIYAEDVIVRLEQKYQGLFANERWYRERDVLECIERAPVVVVKEERNG